MVWAPEAIWDNNKGKVTHLMGKTQIRSFVVYEGLLTLS